MAYLGRQPVIGNFVKLDAITAVNGQAAYTMQNGGSNFTDYESVNQFLVSLNGTIQAPTDSFTVSGSTLTFASNLSTGDVIDFIIVFGNSLSAGTPTDATVTTAKLADSAVTAAKITDATITSAKLASGTVQNQSAFKNIIINGDMSIAQRGTSATGLTNGSSGYHTCDRWNFREGGAPSFVFTQTQDTTVPTGQGFAKSLKMDCTTAQGSLAAGDNLRIDQRIEGQNVQYLKKGTSSAESLTLSFWVYATKTGTNIVELYDNDNSRSISKSYTISSSETWEKKTITIEGDTTGALDNDNAQSLRFMFFLAAGSNFTSGTLQTSWGTQVAANRAVGQVNHADSTSNNFIITGVQLEAGTSASDFEFLPHDVNLQRCQRYCHRIQGISGDEKAFALAFAQNTSRVQCIFYHPTTMRAEPTITESDIEVAYRETVAAASLSSDTDETVNTSTLLFDADSGTPFTAGDCVRIRLNNSASAFLQLDSEL